MLSVEFIEINMFNLICVRMLYETFIEINILQLVISLNL